MIKFFRKIRQKLLEENRFRKYLLYAIGEIILVMIGILLALQVSNWKESRRLKIQEKNYYCQLFDDLNADVSNINETINQLNKRQEATERVLINVFKFPEIKDSILADYIRAVRSKSFIPTKASIDDITSSGKLENITNQELKKAILNYYVQQNAALYILNENNQQLLQKIFDYNSYTEFGAHEIPIYKKLYNNELQNILKSTEWQKDPNSYLFKHFVDHMNMNMIITEREKSLLEEVKTLASNLSNLISPNCNSL